MTADLTLISHTLCPYVQRAAIALAEKAVVFRRVDVDLANKPAWFLAVSPLGRTPVLRVGDTSVFESHAILDYLDETLPPRMHPEDALARAEHRGWIAFASAVLDDIAGLYGATDEAAFDARRTRLAARLAVVEARLRGGPWFDGAAFSLVDAAFAPVFRYVDAFDRIGLTGVMDGKPGLARWRRALARRPSVRAAVAPDYPDRLMAFLRARGSHISGLVARAEAGVSAM
jgi:glutathione S-transferase